jgi:hypothetical protein
VATMSTQTMIRAMSVIAVLIGAVYVTYITIH